MQSELENVQNLHLIIGALFFLVFCYPANSASEEDISLAGSCAGHFSILSFYTDEAEKALPKANQMIETTRAAIQAVRGKSGRATFVFPINNYLNMTRDMENALVEKWALDIDTLCSPWVNEIFSRDEKCSDFSWRRNSSNPIVVKEYFDKCFARPRSSGRVLDERVSKLKAAYDSWRSKGAPRFNLGHAGNPFVKPPDPEKSPFFE